jgi:septal ring factor EnvC (AmiA/AmiB activator)
MSGFSLIKDAGVRMAVLEEKLTVYEELSKEMLSKLESAVDKISEANQQVAKILVRHEERLDKTAESDAAILKLLEESKKQNSETIKEIKDILKDHDKRITDLTRIRWLLGGVILAAGFIIGEGRPLTRLLHPSLPSPPQEVAPSKAP